MKRSLAVGGLIMALAVTAWAQAKPNFSGKWILDVTKSDFGPMPPPESIVHEIAHKEPNVKVLTSQKSAQGATTNERNLTTDGKENANRLKTMAGDQDMKSTSTWDGAKLATAMKLDVQGNAVTIDDVWELSADGKVLTITRRTAGPDGSITQKFVFNKQ